MLWSFGVWLTSCASILSTPELRGSGGHDGNVKAKCLVSIITLTTVSVHDTRQHSFPEMLTTLCEEQLSAPTAQRYYLLRNSGGN